MEDNMNTNVEPTTNEEGQQTNEEKTYTFTQEELDALIQKEGDKRVSSALKTAQKKNEAKIKEAEKLAKMSEQQRYEYELSQREQAIAEKEHQLALAENKAEASSILAEKGISPKLVDFVVADDAEVMMTNISLLEAEFKASVKAEVEKRLQTSTPKKNLPLEMTKESFQKLSIVERTQLLHNNPELYNKLKGA
jgi:hypothetical protein